MTPQPPIPGTPPQGAPQLPSQPDLKQQAGRDTAAAEQVFKQIKVSEIEKGRLKDRVWHDFLAARSDHDNRIARFRRYYRMWRGLNQTRGSDQDGQDFQVPMVKWIVLGQLAKDVQALVGEDAEVIARPTSPADEGDSTAAGHYMTWRLYEYMQALASLVAFLFRGILFGRSHAEIIYEQEYYFERDPKTGIDTEKLYYDGPKLRALWPSQLILPAQDDVEEVDDFDWKIRRLRLTPQQLLDGESEGKYQDITKNWTEIYAAASQRQERDYWWDDERVDSDEAEGVDHTNTLGARDSVEVWRWYGKWRFPTSGRDTRPENIRYRDLKETETLVTFLPKPGIVIGIQDLRDVYPRMRKRSPFVTVATTKDGSYWSPGGGEFLEDIQNEATINHALFRKAGMLSVGPVIFFKPSSGFDPETFEYRPGTSVPSEDPAGVKVVSFAGDLKYPQMMEQTLKAIAELVTGISDQSLGRSSDRPNAPQTASGQAMLINEGNVRASLDMTMLRDDLSRMLNYIWLLDREYADEKVFFRVTGDDPKGFDVKNGFGVMTAEQREHSFSFDMKFATSIWSKEAKKQHLLQLYGLSLQNPIVATNPRALWVLLNLMWEAFGEKNFRDVIPEPPETERPKSPKEEWSLLMEGEMIAVSPLDDDQAHIIDHRRRLEDEINEPPERQDPKLQHLAFAHIVQHERQMKQKQLLQALAARAVQAMAPAMMGATSNPQAGAGPNPSPGGFAPPPVSPAPEPPALGPSGPINPAEQQVTQ